MSTLIGTVTYGEESDEEAYYATMKYTKQSKIEFEYCKGLLSVLKEQFRDDRK